MVNLYGKIPHCNQSILPTMVCRLSLLVLRYKLSKVWRIMLCNPMKALLNQGSFMSRVGRLPVIGWKRICGLWPLSHFYRELFSGCITGCKGSDATWELRMSSTWQGIKPLTSGQWQNISCHWCILEQLTISSSPDIASVNATWTKPRWQ